MNHFFDVGANTGQTFDYYLLNGNGFDGATIWCFEPSPRHLSQLRHRCELFASDTNHNWRINVCGFGLSDRTGWQRLFEKNDGRGDSFFSELYLCDNYIPNLETAVGVICPVVDVVDFILANVEEPKSLTIKIDTEGSEFQILNRILSAPDIWNRIATLMVEWHSTDTKDGRHPEIQRIKEGLNRAGLKEEGWPY